MTPISQKIKKYNLKIKYLTLEHEEVKQALHQYEAEFKAYLISLEQTYKIEIFPNKTEKVEKSSEKIPPPEEIDLKHDRKQDEIFKNLYRDVVKVTHPDKTGDDPDSTRIMRQATRAKNSDDLATLIDICDALEIDTPELEDHHLEIIEKNIKKREEEINRLKNMDAWKYCTGDEKYKTRLEKAIINNFKQ